MTVTIAIRFGLVGCWLMGCGSTAMSDPALDVLVAAYPEQLAGHDEHDLIWKDGTRQPLSDGQADKSFDDLLNHPSIADQFAIRYRLGAPSGAPSVNEDPGRMRNQAFFQKMYGDCRSGEVTDRLRPVAWLPHRGGGTILATTVNGIADKLEQISAELEKLPPAVTDYAAPSAGAYNCRDIADSSMISMHAYGAAVDLNAELGDYWLWSEQKTGRFIWRDRMPHQIVDIFERFGFISGGKWYHFDTFHFEYRPEIINLARQNWPRN